MTQKDSGLTLNPNDYKIVGSLTIFRVQAVNSRLGGLIPAGTLGGYIPYASCLSDDSWIIENAMICSESALVSGGALVTGFSEIHEDAHVSMDAVVSDSKIFGNTMVSGRSSIYKSSLGGELVVDGQASIFSSIITGRRKLRIGANTLISQSDIFGSMDICSDIKIYNSTIHENYKFRQCESLKGYVSN